MHFKTCQIVAGTSMISQFHDFFQSNFWRVFDVWHNCALGGAKPTPAMTEGVRGLEVSVIF